LLFLAAQKILDGRPVRLYEFPLAPINLESYSALRRCKADVKVANPPQLMFADTMNLPFKNGVFDVVATPWLIDILPEDPTAFFRRLNHVLNHGGTWINFGSLVYQYKNPANDYSTEEIIEIAELCGFKILQKFSRKLPYMQSPLSHHGRIETVFCFSAEKVRDVTAPAKPFSVMPEWLIDRSQPVPALHELTSLRAMYDIYTGVLAEIDGKKSISDIARSFAAKFPMPDDEAEASVARYLSRTYQDLRQGR
jgi:hypothetical protein